MEENKIILNNILDKYGLNEDEKKELISIIKDIFNHKEFQKRMSDNFPHHGNITLGEHILEVTVVTYILSKKYKDNPNYSLKTALKIAMLHDLYELPWQNNKEAKTKKLFTKHGFRHPIEAAINANTWYPDLFETNEEEVKIIDGIVHHMFPFPVSNLEDFSSNKLELKNYDKFMRLSKFKKDIINLSTNKNKLLVISVARSSYLEGRVMSRADKIVSKENFKQKNIFDLISLLTGHNINLN